MTCWNGSILNSVANRAPKPRLGTILGVALGGVLGATARVYLPWPRIFGDQESLVDPVPTLLVNLLAAALLGLVTGYCAQRPLPEPLVKGITTGLLGSFSTMSAVAVSYTALVLGQRLTPTVATPAGLGGAASVTIGLAMFLVVSTVLARGMLTLGDRIGRSRP